jgi:hypothetical protein
MLLAGLEAHIVQATTEKFLWDLRKKNLEQKQILKQKHYVTQLPKYEKSYLISYILSDPI